jgi:hypothetical protein
MMVQEIIRPTISTKELTEKRYLDKMLRASIRYAEAKLRGFDFDAQIEQYGNVWRAVLTVGYRPLPVYPQVVDGPEPEMYAVVKEVPKAKGRR